MNGLIYIMFFGYIVCVKQRNWHVVFDMWLVTVIKNNQNFTQF